ncbi:uncharacterized protein LOC133892604 isoform X2 [Phragmites australis]|uniref:uncharacterized protein LOC133892604 isoform X2 n=1 Tax=Phragmites australis TaxID=29695 RepID=UPI002D796CAE|nr:uncharacterized protein LOC133892604 isoform X2 [Phragmites australis]
MDFYSDDSDPDLDDDLREDLDALRRSCILSGADPDAAVAHVSSHLAAPSAADNDGSSDDDEGEDEDLALVRSIRANLHLNKASPASPLPEADAGASSARPIYTWPPSDTDEDEEDDLETLRAIQRRFSHYQSGTSTVSPKNLKSEASQGVHSELFADGPDEEFAVQKQNVKALNRTGFPKAALLLVDALKKNRACQKFIRRKMITIEAKIEENKDLRDRVKCLMGYQLSCRKSIGRFLCQKEDPRVRLISSRKPAQQCAKNKYRKMPALFLGPAENMHVSKYKMVLKQFPMSLQKKPWSDAEKDKLARGIKQQYQETLILDSMNNGSAIGEFNAVDMAYALTNAAVNFEVTPESLRSVLALINWDKISAMYLPGRSGAECESRWLNCDDPLINHNAWTAQEEKRLLLIIQEKGMCNWINIAVTLGTHRTPFQCLARYQRSLNPHIMKKAWTKEEDLQLQAAIETFGDNWQLVSASLDGRTGNQCSNRWRKTLHPKRTRVGRWDLDEDKRLMVSVKLFGSGSWSRIAQFVPGRTQTQCSERWCNVLDPDINIEEWRPEENSKLLASVSEFGPCWAKIARVIIPHRTDSMCYRQWRKLCKHEVPSVKAASQIKKAIFQTNFVDREKERPAIGPGDLISLVHSKGDECDENTGRGRSKNQTEESLAVSDGLNNSSSVRSRSRKRKSTTDDSVAVQNRMRGSIPVDNEAVPKELRGTISADNEVGTNRTRDPVSVGEEGVVKKRTRGSKSVGNEGVLRKRMRGSVSTDNEAGTNRMRDPVSVGEEAVVKKRTRGLKSVGNKGVVRKRMRGSIGTDNEAGTNRMRDPVSVGGVVKKRTRCSNSVGNEGVARKRMQGCISVGDEGIVQKRMMGSVSIENNGGVTKRKRVSSRKSAKDNSTADGMANAAPELDLPIVPSEERVVDAGTVNKGKRKSTPRPKQINMSEGAANKHSTFERLANCLSFARMNGTNRNRR